MEASPLRDQTLQEIVVTALRLYGDTVLPAVPVALLLNLPLLGVSAVSLDPGAGSPWELTGALALVLVCSGVAVSAVTRIQIGALVRKPVAARALPRLTLSRSLFAVTLAFAATSFLSNLGLLMLVLPGLLMGGLLAASVPAALVERRSGLSALGRSARLMRRDLMKAMAGFSFGALASELLPLGLLVGLQSATGPSPFSPLLAVTINGLTLPIALAVNLVLYTSARAAEGATPEALQAELERAAGERPGDKA